MGSFGSRLHFVDLVDLWDLVRESGVELSSTGAVTFNVTVSVSESEDIDVIEGAGSGVVSGACHSFLLTRGWPFIGCPHSEQRRVSLGHGIPSR